MTHALLASVACVLALGLNAQELPPETQAKFLKILLSSIGQFGFACSDAGFKGKLEAAGIAVAPGFKMAWAATEAEVKALKAAGKLVIVPALALLKDGGALAIVDEAGKPQIYINAAHVKASGMVLSDTIVKMAKRAN